MILVTGGTGFLGSRLVNRLVAENQPVRILVRNPAALNRRFATLPPSVEVVPGTVTDLDAVKEAMRGIESVIHLAAVGSPSIDESHVETMMAVNIGGTANVLIAAGRHNVERVVFASSAAVYGDSPESPKVETMPTTPSSAYGVSKVAAEQLCEIYSQRIGFSTISLRFFNIYGPGQDPNGDSQMAIPRFIRAMRDGEPITVFGNGQQRRDFVYVDDCVDALVTSASIAEPEHNVVNIGSGIPMRIDDLLSTIGRAMGIQPKIVRAPARPIDVQVSVAEIRRAASSLGLVHSTSLERGIHSTIGQAIAHSRGY